MKDHVTGGVTYLCIRVCVWVIYKHTSSKFCMKSSFGLVGRYLIQIRENGWINCSRVVKYQPNLGLYVFDAVFIKMWGDVWPFCIVRELAICLNCPFVMCMSWLYWVRMEKKFEWFGGISWHENFNIFLVLIIVEGQSTLVLLFEVHGGFVISFESVPYIISVGIKKVLDTKTINEKTKFCLFVACHQMPIEYLQGT